MSVDAAWVPVLPEMKGFASLLTRGATSAAKTAGAQAGSAMSRAMNSAIDTSGPERLVESLKTAADQAKRAVSQEVAAIARARASENDATAKVITTESKLETARSKSEAAAAQVATAEEAVVKARAEAGVGSEELAAAETALTDARTRSDAASAGVSAAEVRVQAARERQTAAAAKVSGAETTLKAAREQVKVVDAQLATAEGELATVQNTSTGRIARLRSAYASLAGAQATATRGAGLLSTGFTKTTGVVRGLMGKVAGLGSMLGGFAIFAGVSDMMTQAREYQDALTRMSSVTHATGAEMKQAQSQAVALGGDLKLPAATAADAATAMTELAGAGATTAQAIAGARSVLLLQAAASTDAATASKTLGDVMDQFGLRVNDTTQYTANAAHVTDVLTNVTTSASLGIQEVYDSMKFAGPVARSFGISVDEVGGALIELAKNGIKGESAGTALRQALAALANPTKQASTALDDLGVKAFDASGKFVGLPKVLDELQAAQKRMGSSSQQFQGDLAAAFGTRNLASIQVFARGGSAELEEYTKKAAAAGSAQTIAAKAATTMSGAAGNLRKVIVNAGDEFTSKYSTQIAAGTNQLAVSLKSGFELVMAHRAGIEAFGRGVIKVFRDVYNFSQQHSTIFKILVAGALSLGAAFKVFASVSHLVGGAGTALKIFGTIAKVAFSGFGTLIKFAVGPLKALVTSTRLAAAAQTALNFVMDANPIGLVIVGVAALAAGLTYFFTKTETGRKAWKAITTAFHEFIDWIGPAWSRTWRSVAGFFDTNFVQPIKSAWNTVSGAFTSAWNGVIKPAWNAFMVGAKTAVGFVAAVVLTPFYLSYKAFAAVFGWAWTTLIKPAWDAFKTGLSIIYAGVIKPVLDRISLGWTLMSTGASIAWHAVTGAVTIAWNAISGAAITGATSVYNWVQGRWNALKIGATIIWGAITGVISTVWNGIMGVVHAGAQWVYDHTYSKFLAIKVGAAFIWNAITSTMHSDWENLKAIGRSGAEWLYDHVMGPFNRLRDAGKRVFEDMRDAIGTAWNGLKEKAAKPVNFVIDTVYTHGLKYLADSIFGKLGLSTQLPDVKGITGYAGGGVLDGFAPGRDTVHAMLSPGEAILVPELVRAIGPANILQANFAASGRRPGGASAHFAGGGIVGNIGGWFKDKATGIVNFLGDVAGSVKSLIASPVRALLKGAGSTVWGQMGAGIIEKALGGIAGFFTKQTSSLTAGATGLVAAAMKAVQAGIPYVWGGSTSAGLDCSGLVYWASQLAGLNWPRLTAAGYQSASRSIPEATAGPGSLLFWGAPAYHVAINAGGGMMLEEPHPGANARYTKIWGNPSAGIYGGGFGQTYSDLVGSVLASNQHATSAGISSRLHAALYDNGGMVPPGITRVINASGKPEAVLTNEQWRHLNELASGGGRASVTVRQENTYVAADPYVAGTIAARQLTRELAAKGVTL